MVTKTELPLIKSSAQVQTAIAATAPLSKNSDVATSLGIDRWITIALRHLYHLDRI